jgi:hypothetical protein
MPFDYPFVWSKAFVVSSKACVAEMGRINLRFDDCIAKLREFSVYRMINVFRLVNDPALDGPGST